MRGTTVVATRESTPSFGPVVMTLRATAFTIFLCLAIFLGRLTIRGARAATLRETG